MRVKRTRWSPDTCGCIIDYEWDAETPEDGREHRPIAASPCCAAHGKNEEQTESAEPMHARAFRAVIEENQRKNQAVAALMDETGLGSDAIGFSFNETRHLTLRVRTGNSSLTRPIGRSLQTVVDRRIGAGLVTVIEE